MKKECIDKYVEKLESGLEKYMEEPVSQRSAEAVAAMVECWEHVTAMADMISKDFDFTEEDAKAWCAAMENADGSVGGHWSITDTEKFKEEDIPDYVWNAAMNMMYSDYYDVAVAYGVNRPEFYAEMARAFLMDEDAPEPVEKIAAYYHCIVE